MARARRCRRPRACRPRQHDSHGPRARPQPPRARRRARDSDERWLLTYADMITLLMALFMVLFSISSVNISKYRTLQMALKAAFSGDILPGGKSIEQPGRQRQLQPRPHLDRHARDRADSPRTSPANSNTCPAGSRAAPRAPRPARRVPPRAPQACRCQPLSRSRPASKQLQHELNAYAAKHGFAKYRPRAIEQRGLVIRVLTDSLLFSSGKCHPRARAARC